MRFLQNIRDPKWRRFIVTLFHKKLRTSDRLRWQNLNNFQDDWSDRTQQISKRIPADVSVFEFGAGKRLLEPLLKEGCTYTPSDIVSRGPDTFVCNLNARTLPLFPPHDYAVISAVIEYIHDAERFIKSLPNAFPVVVASYSIFDTKPDPTFRRRKAFFNDFTRDELVAIFDRVGYTLVWSEPWKRQMLFEFRARRIPDHIQRPVPQG